MTQEKRLLVETVFFIEELMNFGERHLKIYR